MTNNRKPHVIVLRLAAVLLVLVMLSTSMVAGRYARYTSTATASDSARVAKYEITVSSDPNESIALSEGTPASYRFSVTSGSEVTVEYDLVIILPQALPTGIDISLKYGDETKTLTQTGNQYTARNVGTFRPQGGTHEYTLVFTATQPVGAGMLTSIAIQVDARQVD